MSNVIHWLAINWNWLKVIGAITALLLFGCVVIVDDDGDWFFF